MITLDDLDNFDDLSALDYLDDLSGLDELLDDDGFLRWPDLKEDTEEPEKA